MFACYYPKTLQQWVYSQQRDKRLKYNGSCLDNGQYPNKTNADKSGQRSSRQTDGGSHKYETTYCSDLYMLLLHFYIICISYCSDNLHSYEKQLSQRFNNLLSWQESFLLLTSTISHCPKARDSITQLLILSLSLLWHAEVMSIKLNSYFVFALSRCIIEKVKLL